MPQGVRVFVRVAAVTLLAALTLALMLPDIAAPWLPWGSFGFDAARGGRITNVYPNLPAARAGVRPGDRIDVSNARDQELRSIGPFAMAWPGTTTVFRIRTRDGTDHDIALTSVPWPRSTLDNITDVIEMLVELAFVAIPAWLVLTRPALLTWTFFIFATNSYVWSAILYELLPAPLAILVASLSVISGILAGLGFAAFALLFPRLSPSRTQVRILSVLCAITVPMLAVDLAEAWMRLTDYGGSIALGSLASTLSTLFAVLLYLLGIAFFIYNHARAPIQDRPRIRWVIAGFAVAFGGSLVTFVGQVLPAISISPPVWAINLLSSLDVLVPISVAYAIVALRVVDVRFVLSRALVYGSLTTAAVALLAVLDFAVARQLEETKLGLIVEIAGAVFVGLGMQRMHAWIDSLVDRFVFRSLHDAQRHFHTIGRAMIFARSTRAIDPLVCDEPVRALHLGGAAVYHRTEDGYARTFAAGSPFRDGFDHDHRVVLHLLAERTPIERDGELAVPFTVRDGLLGFALFGAHVNGTAIDPNERELLEALCARAANAYDHVASEERAEENARLRGDLSILQARYEEVKSLARATQSR